MQSKHREPQEDLPLAAAAAAAPLPAAAAAAAACTNHDRSCGKKDLPKSPC